MRALKSNDTHDYRAPRRRYGWDLAYEPLPGNELDAHGWGHGLSKGDYVLLTNPRTSEDTRYQIKRLRYCDRPDDMWFATLSFAPR